MRGQQRMPISGQVARSVAQDALRESAWTNERSPAVRLVAVKPREHVSISRAGMWCFLVLPCLFVYVLHFLVVKAIFADVIFISKPFQTEPLQRA